MRRLYHIIKSQLKLSLLITLKLQFQVFKKSRYEIIKIIKFIHNLTHLETKTDWKKQKPIKNLVQKSVTKQLNRKYSKRNSKNFAGDLIDSDDPITSQLKECEQKKRWIYLHLVINQLKKFIQLKKLNRLLISILCLLKRNLVNSTPMINRIKKKYFFWFQRKQI